MPIKRRSYGRKRRTTAKARRPRRTAPRSRALSALTRRVNKITRENTEKIVTTWSRNQLPIQTVGTSGMPYVCPIPYNAMDPNDTQAPGTGVTTQWRDILGLAVQPYFTKSFQFGHSASAVDSNQLRHTGGTLKWQMSSTEPDYTKVTLALIRPKKAVADQLTADRGLLGNGTIPYGPTGTGGNFGVNVGEDYAVHKAQGGSSQTGTPATYFGTTFNRKYWDVLYQREVAFGHPGAQGFAGNTSANNSSPANNAIIHTGTIKLPAGGQIKSVSRSVDQSDEAVQLGLLDQRNENACYLVAIQNGVTADLEEITMGFIVMDYYTATI